MDGDFEKRPATYIILVATLFILIILYVFKIVDMNSDKFSFFLISLLFATLLIPYLKYLKIFDFVELRRDVKMLKADMENLTSKTSSLKKK